MAINDINRLRQMSLFNQEPIDVMSGGVFGGSPQQPQQPQQQVDPRTVQYPGTINQAFGQTGNQPAPPPDSLPVNQPYDPYSLQGQTGWGTPNAPPPTTKDPIPFESSDDNVRRVLDAIGKVYTPETRAGNRYNELLDHVPVREEPSLARRFVAAGVGLGNKSRNIPGGIGEQEKVLYAPYLRDMAEWKEKTTPFSQASQQENTANVNERTLAGNVVNSIYQNDRVEATNRATQQRAEEAAAKNATQQQALQIKAAKIELENRIFSGGVKNVYTKGKFVYVTTNSGKTVNTGIPGEAVDAMELAKFNADAEINEIKERATQDRETQGATPKAQAATKQIGMQEFYDTHPEWQDFMNSSNGTYSFKKRPDYTWLSGDAADEAKMARYDQMMKAYYGDKYTPPGGQPGAASPQTQTQTQTPPPPNADQFPAYTPGSAATQGLGPTKVPFGAEEKTRAQMRQDINTANSIPGMQAEIAQLQAQLPSVPNQLKGQLERKIGTLNVRIQQAQQAQRTMQQGQNERDLVAGTKVTAWKMDPQTGKRVEIIFEVNDANIQKANRAGYTIDFSKYKPGGR